MQDDQIREIVRDHYGQVARDDQSSACGTGCCTIPGRPELSKAIGYSDEEMASVPEGANLGLGCGNPSAIAALIPGEVVLDLGSGAGFDSFLASAKVGEAGRVIGVDMTADMVTRARGLARDRGVSNVEFRLGEIEYLPVPDNHVDAIMSNCVINLSPDKPAVFRDAYRVLKPGGRLAISDVVALQPLTAELKEQALALAGCVAGAAEVSEIEGMLRDAGFENVQVHVKQESRDFIKEWFPGSGAENYVASATIQARKPAGDCCEPGCCGNES
ncbi:MAG: arsenite methyltransferase [Deltaproteobacteria bacterium]|nr:arsenite methyltransferase [bacterium]MCB9476325.1 arsenite methyltransferase [Deltaproteobacteria bacterium]MCB9489284.1 arsenite methyltransferase [Deltaproteobacteria bacterium]